jgi:hypothetical protein
LGLIPFNAFYKCELFPQETDDPPITIPVPLAKMEEHFKHPVRCHNVRKKKQDLCRRQGLPIGRNSSGDAPGWKLLEERCIIIATVIRLSKPGLG